MRRKSVFIIILVLSLVFAGFIRSYQYLPQTATYLLMDTQVDIVFLRKDRKVLKLLIPYARKLSQMLDFYDKDSCVNKLVKTGIIKNNDECYPVLKDVIIVSQDVYEKSHGVFDPGFRSECSIADIGIDSKEIFVNKNNCVFDFSAVAKGYVVDKLLEMADERGVDFIVINAGGDIGVRNESGVPVVISIKNPFDKDRPLDRLRLRNNSVATSGDYERGKHIVNAHTHLPVHGLISASIIADSCAVADAWATALYIMGESGLQLLDNLGIGAMIAYTVRDGGHVSKIRFNGKWKRYRDRK